MKVKKNRLYLFGILLLVAFAGFSFTAFKDSMTPYVSYERAREGGPHRAGGRRAREGELLLRGGPRVALLHPPGPEDASRPCGCATRG